jgi:hypothetical protein
MITTAGDPASLVYVRAVEQVLVAGPRLSLLVEVDAHEGPA